MGGYEINAWCDKELVVVSRMVAVSENSSKLRCVDVGRKMGHNKI